MADIISNPTFHDSSNQEECQVESEDSSLESPAQEEMVTYPESFPGSDSYPPIHSLLLCPAQWTALLESPVSLVRRVNSVEGGEGDIEESISYSCTIDQSHNNISISGDSNSLCSGVIDSIITEEEEEEEREEEEEDRIVEDEEEETYTLEPVSLTFIEDNIEDTSSNNNNNDCDDDSEVSLPIEEMEGEQSRTSNLISDEQSSVDRQSPLVERTPSTPAHVLPTIASSSFHCITSSEGTCTIEEEREGEGEGVRGNDTPSLSEKSSQPSTPLDNRFPIHFTHSRNVSETPSLPPFISSSSSSAYHSRNSSMASQITSDCFETDSLFTTDIDSCIVTYSNDIHTRPISLQESRFKFPEMSAMEKSIQRQCYSIGDINVTTPICVPEHLFVPSLDETSTTGEEPQGVVVGENFEVKKIGVAAIKSSEWIKKELRRSKQTMIQVKVSSKSRHFVHFNVKAGDMFLWEFATKRKDIAFGLSFEATEVATAEQEHDLTEEENPPDIKMVPILPVLRVNTHAHPVIGSHTATQDGVYELLFDNSYSRFFAKELYYRITTKPSIPNEHYLNQ